MFEVTRRSPPTRDAVPRQGACRHGPLNTDTASIRRPETDSAGSIPWSDRQYPEFSDPHEKGVRPAPLLLLASTFVFARAGRRNRRQSRDRTSGPPRLWPRRRSFLAAKTATGPSGFDLAYVGAGIFSRWSLSRRTAPFAPPRSRPPQTVLLIQSCIHARRGRRQGVATLMILQRHRPGTATGSGRSDHGLRADLPSRRTRKRLALQPSSQNDRRTASATTPPPTVRPRRDFLRLASPETGAVAEAHRHPETRTSTSTITSPTSRTTPGF